MFVLRLMFTLVAIFIGLIQADFTPEHSSLQVRNAAGASPAEISRLLRPSLYGANMKRDGVRKAGVDIGADKKILTADAETTRTKCYMKGLVTAEFTTDGDFASSEEFQNYTAKDEIASLFIEVKD
ncbi:uncharacterized protein RAG0_00713 [Rhynchosporium agropyri]|uniref:Uncharacterized protein n=1 Tax=Rhynchosporium agropyri TaxID=914238 RepID=A0A1E1JUD3_9HELO|nr:uncharacterized protein RAG0_00713 [Rhynchosporium agropyri]